MVRAKLRRSRWLAMALTAVHACAAATLLPLSLHVAIKLAGTAMILASLCHSVWRHALLQARRSITALEIRDQQTGAFCNPDGVWHEAKILGTTYVTPRLTAINLRPAGAWLPRHVLLTADNVEAEDFRRIRVLLRWARPEPPATPSGPTAYRPDAKPTGR